MKNVVSLVTFVLLLSSMAFADATDRPLTLSCAFLEGLVKSLDVYAKDADIDSYFMTVVVRTSLNLVVRFHNSDEARSEAELNIRSDWTSGRAFGGQFYLHGVSTENNSFILTFQNTDMDLQRGNIYPVTVSYSDSREMEGN